MFRGNWKVNSMLRVVFSGQSQKKHIVTDGTLGQKKSISGKAKNVPGFLIQSSCEEHVIACIQDNQTDPNSTLIINNIGNQQFVESCLDAGFPRVICTMTDLNQLEKLKFAFSRHEQVTVENYSWLQARKDTQNQREMALMNQSSPAENGGGLSILTTLLAGKTEGGKELISRFISSHGFFGVKNLQLFCLVSSKFYSKLVNNTYPPYFKTLSAFYNHQLCLKLNKNDFIPSFPIPKEKKTKSFLPELSEDTVCLVQMNPREDVMTKLTRREREMFTRFMRQIKKERLIPKLETLVPGCGMRMIELGFTMSDEMYHVKPDQYLFLFRNLITWPEYQDSMLSVLLTEKLTETL